MVAWLTSLIFILIIAGVFVWVALQSTKKRDYEPIMKKWYKTRTVYGVVVVLIMFVATVFTLRMLPYNKPIYGEASSEPTEVNVEAFQFGWDFSETEFEVGESVKFNVSTPDVTHNFGLYNEDMEIIAQTQAMPEYENEVYVTFDKPGTYTVLCLEYCGLGHHMMTAELEVK